MRGVLTTAALLAIVAACSHKPKPAEIVTLPNPLAEKCDQSRSVNWNGIPYVCRVQGGKWEVDNDGMKRQRQGAQRRRDLYWALRTRVLSTKEMAEVKAQGIDLTVEPMVPYKEAEKQAELNDALLQQFKLRLATEGGKSEDVK